MPTPVPETSSVWVGPGAADAPGASTRASGVAARAAATASLSMVVPRECRWSSGSLSTGRLPVRQSGRAGTCGTVRGMEDLSDLVPLAGGWSGHTFLAETAGVRSVVRIYPPGRRDVAAPEIDA